MKKIAILFAVLMAAGCASRYPGSGATSSGAVSGGSTESGTMAVAGSPSSLLPNGGIYYNPPDGALGVAGP